MALDQVHRLPVAASPPGVERATRARGYGRTGRSRKEIVVISEIDDGHVPLVQAHLPRELIVVDPLASTLTFARGGGRATTISAGEPLENVLSVWYRKPLRSLRSQVELQVAEQHRRYSRIAIAVHAESLQTCFGRAVWVSDPYAIQRAENKALQLELAEEVGLRIPETVITNDAQTAAAFLRTRAASIIKPVCSPMDAGGPTESFFAVRVHGLDGLEDQLPNLRWGPAIFQDAIDAVADVRVTIVGEEVFVARIDAAPSSLGQAGVRDWRYHQITGGPAFRADVILPADVRHGCLALTRALRLEYAALDLVIDRAGTLSFLELNPNGEWGFIELQAGLPIGAAVAALLQRR